MNNDLKNIGKAPAPKAEALIDNTNPEKPALSELAQKMIEKAEKANAANPPAVSFKSGKDYGIRWVEGNGSWFTFVDVDGKASWKYANREDIKTHLEVEHNVSAYAVKGAVSEAAKAMHDTRKRFSVDFAGPFAGYLEPGERQISGSKVLITKAPVLPTISTGDCVLLLAFLRTVFHKQDQLDAFLRWAQGAVRGLREDKPGYWRHGQALVMVGEAGDGKTSLQKCIITKMLTGRSCDPTKYITADTSFNEQLGENEHWLMSDPKANKPPIFHCLVGGICTV